jgi:formate hydrogenlyase transcriptional activator
MGKPVDHIAESSMAALCAYPWPGNVRELRNLIERSMILTRGSILRVSLDHAPSPHLPGAPSGTLEARERDHVLQVLQHTGWRIRGPGGAAERLDIKPTTLESRMKRLGIRRPRAERG